VGYVALQAITVFHFLAVSLVTTQATLVLAVNGVALVALNPCMGRGMFFHGLSHVCMAAQAGCPHGFQVGKVYFFGFVGIVALGAPLGGIVFLLFRAVTFGARRNHVLFPGWMRLVAFGTGKLFGMECAMLGEILDYIFMAGPARGVFYRMVPYVPGRLMGLVACQAVFEFQIRCVFFMAVQARVGLALCKAVGVMTLAAILFRVGARQLFHLFLDVGMAGDADGLHVPCRSKGSYQGGMGIVARCTICRCEMPVF